MTRVLRLHAYSHIFRTSEVNFRPADDLAPDVYKPSTGMPRTQVTNPLSTRCKIALGAVACHRTPLNTFELIGSGYDFMPSGYKPLPEPVLANIYVTLR